MEFQFKKQFGQNFLQNISYVEDVVNASNLKKTDTILEIGPGDGALTERIAPDVDKLICIEIDKEVIENFKHVFSKYENIELINTDFLKFDLNSIKKPYKVVAALPYNISKQIINKLLISDNKPELIVVVIQKEVAFDYANIKPKASMLGTIANIYSDIEFIGAIPKDSFYPMPKVDGGILRFSNIGKKFAHDSELIRLIKIGYSAPRKKLIKNLKNVFKDRDLVQIFKELNIDTNARAQELDITDWNNILCKLN